MDGDCIYNNSELFGIINSILIDLKPYVPVLKYKKPQNIKVAVVIVN